MGWHVSSKNINKIMNVVAIYVGITLIAMGMTEMSDANYIPPDTPAGWIMGMAWIIAGGAVAAVWFLFVSSNVIAQKLNAEKRWTFSTMVTSALVLLLAAGCAILGTWQTWKHPYRIGECLCTEDQWGPFCKPCQCVYGVCHSGYYGTGVCACDFGFAGNKCDRCDDKHKPEPDGDAPACNICKTGFDGDKCEHCAVGYTGDDTCDTCDTGWYPWQHKSDLFPETIADDNRHICDECLPHHFGYYCRPCPVGNDVPMITLARNNPLVTREMVRKNPSVGDVTRVADLSGARGELAAIETCARGNVKQTCTTWTTRTDYDTNNPFVRDHVRLKIRYDEDNVLSDWLLLTQINGFECNNRGTCRDDVWHQENNKDWNKTCTKTYLQECTSHSDCKVSENCRGTCRPLELPVNPLWSNWNGEAGRMCADDSDCRGDPVSIDADGNYIYYTGGRCINRFCCDESYHGDGTCDCNATYFGGEFGEGVKPHHELSPACDFCPGYDFVTEQTSTICSGAQGTCVASYASALEANTVGEYLNMRCSCGSTVYIDPESGIVDTSMVIEWKGGLCECGDVDDDGACDFCATGHWGPECRPCPGGPGDRACSRHGTCNSGVEGDGTCTCDIDRTSSWMLAEYVPRYPGDCDDCGNPNKDRRTCNECAPNFWGEGCWRCDDTDTIKASELDDIFQPQDSFHFGFGQSAADQVPHPVCHPQQPWICSLACGGGGWCDWGRRGNGKCTCWSNVEANSDTWNPLDNVCIGKNRFDGMSKSDFIQEVITSVPKNSSDVLEYCPSKGYCSDSITSRTQFDECSSTCNTGGDCYLWNQIDWRQSRSQITCVPN